MPITLTNRDLLESPPALRKLSDMQIPVRSALKLRKILKGAQAEIETVQEQLKALGKKHAQRVKNEDGTVKLGPDGEEMLAHPVIKKGENGEPDVLNENAYELGENAKAYQKEFDDLLDMEIKLDFDPIKIEDLSDKPDPKQPLKQPELKIETSLLFVLH